MTARKRMSSVLVENQFRFHSLFLSSSVISFGYNTNCHTDHNHGIEQKKKLSIKTSSIFYDSNKNSETVRPSASFLNEYIFALFKNCWREPANVSHEREKLYNWHQTAHTASTKFWNRPTAKIFNYRSNITYKEIPYT